MFAALGPMTLLLNTTDDDEQGNRSIDTLLTVCALNCLCFQFVMLFPNNCVLDGERSGCPAARMDANGYTLLTIYGSSSGIPTGVALWIAQLTVLPCVFKLKAHYAVVPLFAGTGLLPQPYSLIAMMISTFLAMLLLRQHENVSALRQSVCGALAPLLAGACLLNDWFFRLIHLTYHAENLNWQYVSYASILFPIAVGAYQLKV